VSYQRKQVNSSSQNFLYSKFTLPACSLNSMNYISNFTEKLFFKSRQSLSWSRKSLPFVEHKGSSMCSKELATRPHAEPATSSPHLHINFLKIHINNILPSMSMSRQAGWCSGNALHSYMEDPWFELWPAHRLSLPWFFVVSLSCPGKY
jgi:hypothetical protein